jgi:hypothetical protein
MVKIADGVDGGETGISVPHNGTMLGAFGIRPFARRIASLGFPVTYADEGAEFESYSARWQAKLSTKNSRSAADSGLS